jgi:2-haloacid dehalogenase
VPKRSEELGQPIPPEVFAFDLLGTLFSLGSLDPLFKAAGGDATSAQRWFSLLQAEGFALTAAREYQPFRDVAKASLLEVLPTAKAAARDRILAGLSKLDVHPDAAPAMGRVVMNGRVAVISNASADVTRKLLAHGGLDTFAETVVTPEKVKQWKPGADPYAFAAAVQETPLEKVAVVTVHPWDVLGARNAGLVTGWCNRQGDTFPAPFGKPTVTGKTLVDVVEALFALRES